MNKLFTKIAGLSLGLAMAIGVGVAVGSKEAKSVSAAGEKTFSNVTGSAGSYKLQNGSTTTDYWQTNASSNETANLSRGLAWSKTAATLTYTPTSNVTALSLVGSSNSAGQTISYKIGSGSSVTVGSMTKDNNKTYTFSNFSCASGSQITISITAGSKSTWVKSITITESSGAQKLATPSLTYNDNTKKVSWSVEHASSYQVKVDSGSYATGTSPYDVSGLTTGVSHTIYVIAKGDGTNYTDSDAGQTSFTPTAPAVYTSVSVSGGNLVGTDKGSAYIQCNGTAQGTNIPASPSFTWYVTATNSYGTTTTVTGKASIDNTGKVTFLDNCTVYVWALAPDGSVHNTSGYEAVASGLVSPKGSEDNPYTVSEARGIATSTSNNTHVTGIIYEVSSYNSTYKSITYWISDDGTGSSSSKDGLQIYSGKGLNGADFSGTSDLTVGSTVVVQGDLKIYQTYTYELDKNSVIKSITLPKELSSIAVKTAPTKTAYKANENFAPAGLVITLTYSDSTTEDVAYSDVPGSFSFSPSVITAAGDVTITFREKTCTQAVTLITVTNVTSVASAPTEVYQNGSIDASQVTLNVTYSDSTSGTVTADSVSVDTSAIATGVIATATYNAATGTKTATWSVDVIKEPVFDYIVDELVVEDTGISGTSYGNWSGVTKVSGAVYAGNTNENNNGGIGMRQDTSKVPAGIIVTSTPGVATKVEVDWSTTTSRTLHVKGQDTPYSSIEFASDVTGTEVGTITYSSTKVDLTAEYKYICLYVTGGAAGFNSIKITWKIEGAADPLTANPVLSTGAEAEVHVGKNIALGVTTTPVDSDEKLIVSSSNESYVTVSGSGRNYVIHGVAVGSATITVAGAKGVYSSSVLVTVSVATKTYEDKVLTPDDLGITTYETSATTHTFDGADFVTKQVMKSGGFQFHKGDGYLYNDEALYSSNNIKSVTLIMRSSNTLEPTVYEGATAGAQTTQLSSKDTFVANGVNTYLFSGSTQFFRIDASSTGAVVIEKIIIEMEDSASTTLTKARSVASAILSGLSGLCGESGSGFVTEAQWNSINSAISNLGLTEDDKLFLKNADRIAFDKLDQGGAEIENAMAHYDACVAKFGYTPFTGITNVQALSRIPVMIATKNASTAVIVVVISAVAAAAIGGYFLFRKKKEN